VAACTDVIWNSGNTLAAQIGSLCLGLAIQICRPAYAVGLGIP
jgi:hypothetical protein